MGVLITLQKLLEYPTVITRWFVIAFLVGFLFLLLRGNRNG